MKYSDTIALLVVALVLSPLIIGIELWYRLRYGVSLWSAVDEVTAEW